MGTITVRSRGRITIPAHLRKKYGFTENTTVEFVEEDGKIFIRKPVTILDLAGTGIGDPEEIKKQLDQTREYFRITQLDKDPVILRAIENQGDIINKIQGIKLIGDPDVAGVDFSTIKDRHSGKPHEVP